jgi:hypothetical protein
VTRVEPDKVVIVIDGELPVGLAMNTVAALALTVGRTIDGILGEDVNDADGFAHPGITKVPVPILKSDARQLSDIVIKAAELTAVFVVDFTKTAQMSRTYDEYGGKMSSIGTADLQYIGIAISGSKRDVNKIAGSLPLYR